MHTSTINFQLNGLVSLLFKTSITNIKWQTLHHCAFIQIVKIHHQPTCTFHEIRILLSLILINVGGKRHHDGFHCTQYKQLFSGDFKRRQLFCLLAVLTEEIFHYNTIPRI
jgi:hypothetical protein